MSECEPRRPPIRILMVRAGGWEQWVETVAEYLGSHGFAVHVVAVRAGSPTAPSRRSLHVPGGRGGLQRQAGLPVCGRRR